MLAHNQHTSISMFDGFHCGSLAQVHGRHAESHLSTLILVSFNQKCGVDAQQAHSNVFFFFFFDKV